MNTPYFEPIAAADGSSGNTATVTGSSNRTTPTLKGVQYVSPNNVLPSLRNKIQKALNMGMLSTARFLADKVVAISQGQLEDVLTLAQVYFRDQQYARSLATLRRFNALSTNARCVLLAGQCLCELREWDMALETLGEDSGLTADAFDKEEGALLCLLRGKIYDALENNPRAVQWLRNALELDKYCFEAFELLSNNHMLSCEEENQLLSALSFDPEDTWLQAVYTSSTKEYIHRTDVVAELGHGDDPLHLANDLSILSNSAAHHYACQRFQKSLGITKRILAQDPFRLQALPVHICCLVELSRTSDLFCLAHKLCDEYPGSAVSLFAIACYYFMTQKFDMARRYFSKATSANVRFAPAWIGFGHSFAIPDETDQAMTAYRTASRLFSGLHEPLLYTGMEYLRTHNVVLAEQWFRLASRTCPTDPLIYNELGVMHFESGDYTRALSLFREALALIGDGLTESWEATLSNTGHACRKLRQYDDAIMYYEKALGVVPNSSQVLTSIGFTYHLQGKFEEAIEHYHKALGIKAEDVFTTEMLSRALNEFFQSPAGK